MTSRTSKRIGISDNPTKELEERAKRMADEFMQLLAKNKDKNPRMVIKSALRRELKAVHSTGMIQGIAIANAAHESGAVADLLRVRSKPEK